MEDPTPTILALTCERLGVEPCASNASLILEMLHDSSFPACVRDALDRYLLPQGRDHRPVGIVHPIVNDLETISSDHAWRRRHLNSTLLDVLDKYRTTPSFDALTREHRLQLALPLTYGP